MPPMSTSTSCAVVGWLIAAALAICLVHSAGQAPAGGVHACADKDDLLRVADAVRDSNPPDEVRLRRPSRFERAMKLRPGEWHPIDKINQGYSQHYGPWLAPLRHRPIRVLEIGVRGGTSMRLWNDYFTHPDARIVGMGIPPPAGVPFGAMGVPIVGMPRVSVSYGSQANASFLQAFIAASEPFDVIIDDASHVPQHGLFTLTRLFGRALVPGGRYILEDTHTYYKPVGSVQYGFVYKGTGPCTTPTYETRGRGGAYVSRRTRRAHATRVEGAWAVSSMRVGGQGSEIPAGIGNVPGETNMRRFLVRRS